MLEVDQSVQHKHGSATIVSKDTTTYSIPMYTARLLSGPYAGELVVGCEMEFTKGQITSMTCDNCGAITIF
jgi:hypothetical protein